MLEHQKYEGTLPNKIPNEFPFDIWVFPKNRGTPKSSILIGFSIMNHPFWGNTLFLEAPICHLLYIQCWYYTFSRRPTVVRTWSDFLPGHGWNEAWDTGKSASLQRTHRFQGAKLGVLVKRMGIFQPIPDLCGSIRWIYGENSIDIFIYIYIWLWVELSVCFNLDAFITGEFSSSFFWGGSLDVTISGRPAGGLEVWQQLVTSTANEPTIDSLTEFCLHDLWLVKVMLLKDTSTKAGIQWSTRYRFLYSFCKFKWWLSYPNTLFTRQARVFSSSLGPHSSPFSSLVTPRCHPKCRAET